MLAGLIQFQKVNYEKAIPLFRKAEVLRPDFQHLSKYLAICYFGIKQHALFELQIEKAMIQTPMDPELSFFWGLHQSLVCLLYTSPSPRDATLSRMPSSA